MGAAEHAVQVLYAGCGVKVFPGVVSYSAITISVTYPVLLEDLSDSLGAVFGGLHVGVADYHLYGSMPVVMEFQGSEVRVPRVPLHDGFN